MINKKIKSPNNLTSNNTVVSTETKIKRRQRQSHDLLERASSSTIHNLSCGRKSSCSPVWPRAAVEEQGNDGGEEGPWLVLLESLDAVGSPPRTPGPRARGCGAGEAASMVGLPSPKIWGARSHRSEDRKTTKVGRRCTSTRGGHSAPVPEGGDGGRGVGGGRRWRLPPVRPSAFREKKASKLTKGYAEGSNSAQYGGGHLRIGSGLAAARANSPRNWMAFRRPMPRPSKHLN